jgi:hypothetical protein
LVPFLLQRRCPPHISVTIGRTLGIAGLPKDGMIRKHVISQHDSSLIIDHDVFSRPDGQLVSSYPDFSMASGLDELMNAFLIVSRLTIVRKYARKNSHPFAEEFSTEATLVPELP